MFNGLTNSDDKKMAEPFNLVGPRSLIFSKEEAVKILKDNSYYIFIAAILNLGFSIFLFIKPTDINVSKEYLLLVAILYCLLGVGIRKFKSRTASLFALASFGYILVNNIVQEGTFGGFQLFTFIFCAASYRAVKASFYYHRIKLLKG